MEMGAIYQDPWLQYKTALEAIKKKFLKKPNYRQALVELESLALRCQDEECEQYSGMCHIQIAKIYAAMDDWSEQHNHLLKAARFFKGAETKNHCKNVFTCSDFLNFMHDCYNGAIKLMLEHQCIWLAGLHCTEFGSSLCELDRHKDALNYLSKGAQLLQVEFRSRIAALKKLLACQVELGFYTDALATVDELWTVHMKNTKDPKFGYGEELLKNCEIASVLLLLQRKNDDISPRHRLLLAMYDQRSILSTEGKGNEKGTDSSKSLMNIPPEHSALNREEYIYFHEFIYSLRLGNVPTAQNSFAHLEKYFSQTCMQLAAKLLSKLIDKGSLKDSLFV